MISAFCRSLPGAFPALMGVCFMRTTKLGAALAAGMGGLMAASASQAAVSVTDIVTEIEGAAAPIASIGLAVLVILVGLKVYKWIRRAL